MKIAYLVPEAPIGYGLRIYIPYEHHDAGVCGFLKKQSIWGGYDKDTGKCYGYEFPNPSERYLDENLEPIGRDRFENAKRYLLVRGFKLEDQSEKNQGSVWGN